MQDPPTLAELVGAVRDFLQSDTNAFGSGRGTFLMRVTINVLGIVEREIEMGPREEAAEHERLRALLDREGTTGELNRELCRQIREGKLTKDNPALMAHLRATTLAKLSIDQPKYSGYQAALRKT